MPDIFDEVEEDLRAERAQRLWKRYGGVLTGALLLALAGVAAFQGWRWYEEREAQQAATAYIAAHRAAEAEGADLRAAAGQFADLAREAPQGYETLARLRAAALLAETGQRDEALAMWDAVALDASADPLYRELASLLWALHSLDSADPGMLATRLVPLTRPESPWRASAQELNALVALRRGEQAEAKRILTALAGDVTAPPGVRERAGRIAAGIAG